MAIAAVSFSFSLEEIVRSNGAEESIMAGTIVLGLLVALALPTYIMKGLNHLRKSQAAKAAIQTLPNQELVAQQAESQQVIIK